MEDPDDFCYEAMEEAARRNCESRAEADEVTDALVSCILEPNFKVFRSHLANVARVDDHVLTLMSKDFKFVTSECAIVISPGE